MSDQEFRDLVRKMRAAQKAYFKDRRSGDLELSKRLEAAVDRELRGDQGDGEPDMFAGVPT